MTKRGKPRGLGNSKGATTAVAASSDCDGPHGPAPSGARAWKPITLAKSLSVSGGYQRKTLQAESMEVGDDIFVKLDKNAEWFLKSVGGPSLRKGGLQRTRVIEELRQKCGIDTASPQKPAAHEILEDDPMGRLDMCLYEGDASGAKEKKKHYQPKRAKEKVMTVEMPLRALGRSGGQGVSVRLMPKGTNSLWIHSDNVPWLVAYAADELGRGGIPQQPEDDDALSAAGNCSVPGLAIRWDFSTNDGWEAVWVDGPVKGKIVRSALSDLNPEKWSRVDGATKFGSELGTATLSARKQAVWALLEMHCSVCLKDATKPSS
jgi:hypothetical protein